MAITFDTCRYYGMVVGTVHFLMSEDKNSLRSVGYSLLEAGCAYTANAVFGNLGFYTYVGVRAIIVGRAIYEIDRTAERRRIEQIERNRQISEQSNALIQQIRRNDQLIPAQEVENARLRNQQDVRQIQRRTIPYCPPSA